MTDDLEVRPGLIIPSDELQWSFSTSGGPGGQHANRSNTRVELRFDVERSTALTAELLGRVRTALASRLQHGVIVVVADDTRSQWRNRQIARRRLIELLEEATRPPAPPRRKTKPSRAVRQRRRDAKRRRSETKKLRKRPGVE